MAPNASVSTRLDALARDATFASFTPPLRGNEAEDYCDACRTMWDAVDAAVEGDLDEALRLMAAAGREFDELKPDGFWDVLVQLELAGHDEVEPAPRRSYGVTYDGEGANPKDRS